MEENPFEVGIYQIILTILLN